MTRSWVSRTAAGIAASALLSVACSGDDASDPSAEPPGDEAAAPEEAAEATDTVEAVYPGQEWAEGDAAELGFDPDRLEELAGEAETQESYCLVVTRHGQLAAEWYWQDTDPTSQHEAFSATKSYTSTLVGLAVDEGHLALDDKVSDHIPEWVGTPSEDITVRDVISNISGRNWAPADYIGITTAPDATAYAIDLGQDVPPGSAWLYNDGAIQTLQQVLESATGQSPTDYAQEKVLDPIGAANSHMSEDSTGNTLMYFGLQSTCRDMARFGYLFLRDGRWDGTQVLPDSWVEEATAQPSQDLNAAYGYLWWLNHEGTQARPGGGEDIGEEDGSSGGRLVPDAPESMYWAQGLGGQIIQVHPETDTVVVRMGVGSPGATYGSPDTARIVTEALDP